MLIIGVSGVAIDLGRASMIKARISMGVDAATLSAARTAADLMSSDPTKTASEVALAGQAAGNASIAANVKQHPGVTVKTSEFQVSYDNGAWKAESNVVYNVPTTLTGIFGWRTMDVGARSKAALGAVVPVLDIAMCVDSTGSMQPTLDTVKSNAMGFYSNLNAQLVAKGLPSFPLVRVRMIYFKDYGDTTAGVWDPDPQRASSFFSLPGDSSSFDAFVSPQVAYGGGDTPESGLECVNEAIDSQWIKVGDVPSGFSSPVTDVYPLIVVWTDAPAHPLPFPNSLANPAYPSSSKMPRTNAAMLAKWSDASKIDQKHKQILFFGNPDITSPDQNGFASGWEDVKTWPRFTVGGSLLDANTSMIDFLATGIAKTASDLRLTN